MNVLDWFLAGLAATFGFYSARWIINVVDGLFRRFVLNSKL